MRVLYTHEAKLCLKQIADYLKESGLSSSFVAHYIQELRKKVRNLLTTFPEAGTEQLVDGVNCRRVVVKEHNILYSYEAAKNSVHILFVYKQNLPHLQ